MGGLVALAQALGLSYAAGINLYATVAVAGLVQRAGWVGPLPGGLEILSHPAIIAIALLLLVFEFAATLVPGIASAWETFHTLVRPPAAAVLAVLTTWHGNAFLVVLAALLGGGLAVTTHTTKLGLRYAIDTSPEPVTNGAANVAELGFVSALVVAIWSHPFLSLAAALVVLVLVAILVRAIWRALGRVLSGNWMPRSGYLQGARVNASELRGADPPLRDDDD